ncbi:C40 family peptidase [Amycolatopsis acidicola]|uniref:C40 family peptidase n=1 Tax=Amycolatopsis acidicola TaxID=2596893 RepID=UPI001FB736DB|nr:NlpC/P60 family protein [Amycolatopsis acidicola]
MRIAIVLAVIAGSGASAVYFAQGSDDGRISVVAQPAASSPELKITRREQPARTVVTDAAGTELATFTDGSQTVVLKGPQRTFADPRFSTATVTTTAWVRLAPEAWTAQSVNASWFTNWLDTELANTRPDVLAIATDYLDGAPTRTDDKGVAYAGDASFGPEIGTGKGRDERSDFYDYLGEDWNFPDTRTQQAEPARYRMIDCSGFVRLVYGYRSGIPLRGTNTPGPGLPRRAWAIAEYGQGTAVIPNQNVRATDYDALQPGDLVFFNIDPYLGDQIDHAGIYLGLDSTGHHRFMSSRAKANGPTLGDLGGTSLLDDGGYYSQALRTARRL